MRSIFLGDTDNKKVYNVNTCFLLNKKDPCGGIKIENYALAISTSR